MIGVLWDLDGTLIDSVHDIARAANTMLRELGLAELPVEQIRGFVGDGANKLVDRCVLAAGGALAADQLVVFRSAYRSVPVRDTRVFEGIVALLEDVAVPQAVVTNKPEEITRVILAELGLARFFPVVVGGETLPVRKPAPEPIWHAMRQLGVEDAVMVGDGPADVGAARAAGIPMIGVRWGISEPEGAALLVDDPSALRAALAKRGLLR